MKLRKFNTTTVISRTRQVDPTISFSKTGLVRLNKIAAELMKLKAGSKISIVYDESGSDDWYIVIGDKDGFPLIMDSKLSNLIFNCSTITKAFLYFIQVEANTVTLKIAKEKITQKDPDTKQELSMYCILNASARYKS